MTEVDIISWMTSNWVELVGAILGFLFLYLEIKENILLWPVGLLSALFYVFIFFQAKFYADSALQCYFVIASLYGWYQWQRKDPSIGKNSPSVRINRCPSNLLFRLIVAELALFVAIKSILQTATDSPVPHWDALITSLSMIGTYMLAIKVIEHWYVWILVNAISVGVYFWKGLFLTSGLYLTLFVFSFVGLRTWNQNYKRQELDEHRTRAL